MEIVKSWENANPIRKLDRQKRKELTIIISTLFCQTRTRNKIQDKSREEKKNQGNIKKYNRVKPLSVSNDLESK